MKNRYLFFGLLILVFASAIYFFKDEIFKPREVSAWNFVPKNAISVWESNSTIEVWNRFLQTNSWTNFSSIPSFGRINQDLIYLDSLTGSNGILDQILKTEQFLISTHTISRNSFDHVFYLGLSNPQYRDLALQITESFQQNPRISYSERSYHDQLIIELKSGSKTKTFSYFVRDNYFVASFTPFLVEDAIRTIKKESDNFKDENRKAFELARLEFDAGDLYLNLDHFHTFSGLFFNDPAEQVSTSFQGMSGSGIMDVDFDENYIFANGFLVTSKDSSYLSVFSNQRPVISDFSHFIPGDAAKIFYQSFTDPEDWHQKLRIFWEGRKSGINTSLNSLGSKVGFDLNRMLSWMQSGLILVDFESVDENPEKLILIDSKDVHESLNQLNRISESINSKNGDTLYYENYGNTLMRLLNLDEFPSKVFGDWYKGFPVTYYTVIDRFIVLGNDVEPIKKLISDRESENTWGQSLSKSEFLTNTLDESNLGLIIYTPKAWNSIESKLAPYWKEGWEKYSRTIKQIELVSMQISHSSDKFYTSMVIKNRGAFTRDLASQNARTIMASSIGSKVFRKPKIVRNHDDGSWEILAMDSLGRISLFDENGQRLWRQFLEGTQTGEISQIDFYKNRKLQYLVATDSLLYVIDRNGELVESFPVDIADIATDELKVIDYDNSKNYRFMLAERNGKAFLLDKAGKRLDGWSPRNYPGRFSIYPFHLRVRGRDIFLAVMENGQVVATNRRGEEINGFPVDLDTRISGEAFHQVKSNFERTIVTVVSEGGEVIQFNMEGKILDRRQLYRPAMDTRFWLVKESQGKAYVIARQDLNRLALLDKNGEVLFEKDYLESKPFHVQYYNFGSDQDMFIVSNAEQGHLLVYDGNGTLMASPLKSDFPASVINYESRSRYQIYAAAADSLYIYSIGH